MRLRCVMYAICSVCLCLMLTSLPARATLSDQLVITGPGGNLLVDTTGRITSGTTTEGGSEGIEPFFLNAPAFDPALGNPMNGRSLSIILTEGPPDGSCLPPNQLLNPKCSDAVTVSLIYFVTNPGGGALQIGLQSDSETPFTGNLGSFPPAAEVMETGHLTDITALLTSLFGGQLMVFNGTTSEPITVQVSSDSELPEPGGLTILALAIAALVRLRAAPRTRG